MLLKGVFQLMIFNAADEFTYYYWMLCLQIRSHVVLEVIPVLALAIHHQINLVKNILTGNVVNLT